MHLRCHPSALVAAALAACVLAAPTVAHSDWAVDGTPVAALAGMQANPTAYPDGAGGLYVAWDDTRAGLSDIYLQHLTRAGVPSPGWPENGLAVCTWAGPQNGARLCGDGAGGVYVAFVEQSNGAGNTNIHIQRVTAGGAFAPGWPAANTYGLAVCTAINRQNTIRMTEDGGSGVLLAWIDQRFNAGSNDLAFTHVLGDATVDPAWPVDGLDPFNDVWGEEAQVVLPDGAGGMWVGWADSRNFPYGGSLGWDISYTHLTGAGVAVPSFPATGLPVTAIVGVQHAPAMVPDGAGGLLFAFRDERAGAPLDIYAQRMDPDGNIHAGWPARSTALPLSTVTGNQEQPVAVSDGAGGMLVVWKDYRTSPSYRLYATRVTGAGAIAPGWPSAEIGGLALCDVAADQQQHAVLADGAGGAFVVWRDSRNATTDLYATRITGDGSLAAGWPAAGVALCAAAGNQQTPTLVTDAAGGAYVVWADFRADAGDVYASHLTPTGLAAPGRGVEPAPAARFALRLASPNPSAGVSRFALTLPGVAAVRADVLDAGGRRVRALPGGDRPAGTQTLEWDGLTDAGRPAAAGLYFVTVTAGADRRSVRLVVTR